MAHRKKAETKEVFLFYKCLLDASQSSRWLTFILLFFSLLNCLLACVIVLQFRTQSYDITIYVMMSQCDLSPWWLYHKCLETVLWSVTMVTVLISRLEICHVIKNLHSDFDNGDWKTMYYKLIYKAALDIYNNTDLKKSPNDASWLAARYILVSNQIAGSSLQQSSVCWLAFRHDKAVQS